MVTEVGMDTSQPVGKAVQLSLQAPKLLSGNLSAFQTDATLVLYLWICDMSMNCCEMVGSTTSMSVGYSMTSAEGSCL